MRGAPVSWVVKERIAPMFEAGLKGFPAIAPDVNVEVMCVFDDPGLPATQDGPVDCRRSAGRVADPAEDRRVTIYRAGKPAEVLEDPAVGIGDGPVIGFELSMARIWDW